MNTDHLAIRLPDNRTPAERIAGMKAADMHPESAAPAVVVVADDGDGVLDSAVSQLARMVGETVADRRWLMSVVDAIVRATEHATRYAEACAAGAVERSPHEDERAAGFAAGVNHLADAITAVMNERPFPLADGGIVTAPRRREVDRADLVTRAVNDRLGEE